MTDNFNNTVNLKERLERAKKAEAEARAEALRQKELAEKQPVTKAQKRAEAIDKVFESEGEENRKFELKTIYKPEAKSFNLSWIRPTAIVLGVLVLLFAGYWFVFKGKKPDQNNAPQEVKWYAVKLVTGEEYYGKIKDTSSDPVVLESVYYNYEQLNQDKNATKTDENADNTNLRLVKRGKETHGPEGTMDLVRTQVVYMEPLKEDSKVLKAILEYEKK